MPRANAITDRLARLYRQWEGFATDPEATTLRWLFRADELRMFEAFLATEDDEGGQLPALFVVLDAPFRRTGGHGEDLQHQLEQQLRALGVEPWRSSEMTRARSDIGSLMESCSDAVRQLGDELEQLVLVLWPRAIEDTDAAAAWLARAARVLPERVRLVVVDRAEAPQLDALSEAAPPGLRTIAAQLDMPDAISQLCEAASDAASPGGRIRTEHLAMTRALSRGDTASACEHASRAQSIARDAGMPHLEVATSLSLAAGLLAASSHDAALREYAKAEQLAEAARSTPEDDWAGTLALQARLGRAAVLVALDAWEHAAERYVDAAGFAGELPDRVAAFEALRMAAAAYERAGLLDDAWAHGLAALDLAARLDAATLSHSTAGWLGELMLRLCERGTDHQHEREALTRRLDHLFGDSRRPTG